MNREDGPWVVKKGVAIVYTSFGVDRRRARGRGKDTRQYIDRVTVETPGYMMEWATDAGL